MKLGMKPEEFEKTFGIIYAPHLIFSHPFSCSWVFKTDFFADEIKALGSLYPEKYAGKFIDTDIKWINDDIGYGLFAARDIQQHEYAGEYTGEVHAISRLKTYNNDYFMKYPQMFWSWNYYVIDATHCGNESRFINHSYSPNLKIMAAQEGGIMHVLFFANQFIPKGSQLFINYGKDYWRQRATLIKFE